jgi:hypothetical protein
MDGTWSVPHSEYQRLCTIVVEDLLSGDGPLILEEVRFLASRLQVDPEALLAETGIPTVPNQPLKEKNLAGYSQRIREHMRRAR